jgi:hypothetical protein
MNNIQLNSIPKKMYLFIKPTRSSYTVSQTDTFARINTVSIQFGNRSSLLGNCDANQLYSISKRNGVDADFSNWYGSTNYNKPRNWSGCGSVLALSPWKDLGLSDYATSGTSSTIQVQVQVNYTNIQPSAAPALQYDAYLIVVDDGLISLPGPNVCLQQNSVVAPTDLLNAHMVEASVTTEALQSMEGGNFFTDVKHFFSSPTFQKVWSVAKQVAPIVAPLVGLGMSGGADRRFDGRGLVGGKAVSKKKLLQLMR